MFFNIAILNYRLQFHLKLINSNRVAWTTGITNLCKDDGRVVVTMDYDNVPLWRVEGDIKYLQNKFGLSDAYILRSGTNSFHAMIPDKLEVSEFLRVLDSSCCDEAYKRAGVSIEHGWALRTHPKGNREAPVFECVIIGVSDERPKSRGHIEFLRVWHGLEGVNMINADDSPRLVAKHYETISRLGK